MTKDKDITIKMLLDKAQALLMENIEEEVLKIESDADFFPEKPGKYEKALALFYKILAVDPQNQDALKGKDICEEMLQPYHPVQYMVPSEGLDIAATPSVVDNKEHKKKQGKKQLPWEMLKERRIRDRRGLDYTASEFGKAEQYAKREIEKILSKFIEESDIASDYEMILKETKKIINEYQEKLNQSWKGHGPSIISHAYKYLARYR